MSDNLSDNVLNPVSDSNDTQIINNEEIKISTEEQVLVNTEAIQNTEPEIVQADTIVIPETPEVTATQAITESENINTPAPVAEKSNEAPEVSAKAKEREAQMKKFDEIFEKLKAVKESDGTIDVRVIDRIRGGLRVIYHDMPMFLPASHFSLKRNPTEQSMFDVKGKTLTVHIHELQVDESKRKTVIVSGKKILEDKFWDSLKIGDVIEAPITSIAQFGVFVDVYGVEGLIHVTRLSNTRIEDLKTTYKKGQLMKAVIVDISKEKKRIGLSSRELEESPWKGLSDELKPGNLVKGVVRRITEFGAYVEVKPNVDGLVRTNEISWTLRIKHPNEVFTQNQEDEFYVVSVQEDKGILALSIKRKSENPWKQILEKYPAKTKVNGTIKFLEPQGAVININNEVDGFMPRSKMRFLPKGNGNPGDVVEVIIDNVDLEKESMIVIPIMDDKPQYKPKEKDSKPKGDFKPRHNKDASESNTHSDSNASNDSASFTLQDLISDSMKKNLLKV